MPERRRSRRRARRGSRRRAGRGGRGRSPCSARERSARIGRLVEAACGTSRSGPTSANEGRSDQVGGRPRGAAGDGCSGGQVPRRRPPRPGGRRRARHGAVDGGSPDDAPGSATAVLDGSASLVARAPAASRRSSAPAPAGAGANAQSAGREVRQGDHRDPAVPGSRPPIPSQSEIPGVVRVERRQDDVHVQERRRGQHEIGGAPAPRERGQDRPEREERVEVALVDAGRQEEERDREERDADEDRQPVRPAGDDERDEDERREQERRADDDARQRTDPERRRADRAARRPGWR